MPRVPRTKGGFTLWGCTYHQMNRNISGVPRHQWGSTCHPAGISTPDAAGASPSRSLQRRRLGYGWGSNRSQRSSRWTSEMKGCRPRGIFHSVKSRGLWDYGTRSWFQHSFKFLFQVAAEWSAAIIRSASTSSSSAATSDFVFDLLREDPLTSPMAQQPGPGN